MSSRKYRTLVFLTSRQRVWLEAAKKRPSKGSISSTGYNIIGATPIELVRCYVPLKGDGALRTNELAIVHAGIIMKALPVNRVASNDYAFWRLLPYSAFFEVQFNGFFISLWPWCWYHTCFSNSCHCTSLAFNKVLNSFASCANQKLLSQLVFVLIVH